jgi:hypothetical protein
MENENEILKEEIKFLRGMLLEASKTSENWKKAFKYISIVFGIVLIFSLLTWCFIGERYLHYAYDPQSIENQNTTTNTNTNINENKN